MADPRGAGTSPAPDRLVPDLLALGARNREAGDLRGARSAFEQALRLSPNNAYANYQLAMIDDDQGRFAEAEKHYIAVLNQSPDHPADVLASMGWSYQLQGRYEDSERVLRDALRYDSRHQTALYNLGWLYGTRGEYDRALTVFREAGSEAQAQQALVELRQTAGGRAPAIEQAYASGTQNMGSAPVSKQGNAGYDPMAAQIDPSNPQAKKFIEDYQKKLAEQNRQKAIWNQNNAARGVAAPDPWKNGRGASAVAGQRNGPPAVAIPGDPGFQGSGRAYQAGATGQYVDNGAAFAGSAPTQANQARQADPAIGSPGDRPFPAGMTNSRSAVAQNLNYEQPPGAATRPQSPVITPGTSGGMTSQQAAPPNNGSWNSLPPDSTNSSQPPASRNVSADFQGLEWTPAATGPSGQPASSGGVVHAAIPQAGAATGGRNPWQDAQTTAAQLGLSAGTGGIGLPLSDWSNGTSPQIQNTPPANQNPPRNASQPSNTGGWPQGPGAGNDLRQLQPGPQQNNQSTPGGAAAQSSAAGTGLAPWSGRPLGAAAVPAPVVPSAQGAVYGTTDQSALPNFYSGRTLNSRQQ